MKRRLEDVLKTSLVFVFRKRLWVLSSEDVFKTSWSRRIYSPYSYVFRRHLQDVFKTSSSRPTYSSWSYVFKKSSRRFQDVFKTFSRRFQDVLKTSSTRPQDVSKMFWKRLQDVFKTSSRRLQDIFKTYYLVKLFLVTQFQDVFKTYSKRFWNVLLRRLSTGGLPRSHFREVYGQCTKFPRVIKISQVVIFHFTTPFSGYTLQRCI